MSELQRGGHLDLFNVSQAAFYNRSLLVESGLRATPSGNRFTRAGHWNTWGREQFRWARSLRPQCTCLPRETLCALRRSHYDKATREYDQMVQKDPKASTGEVSSTVRWGVRPCVTHPSFVGCSRVALPRQHSACTGPLPSLCQPTQISDRATTGSSRPPSRRRGRGRRHHKGHKSRPCPPDNVKRCDSCTSFASRCATAGSSSRRSWLLLTVRQRRGFFTSSGNGGITFAGQTLYRGDLTQHRDYRPRLLRSSAGRRLELWSG